jgi:hypothetical protein
LLTVTVPVVQIKVEVEPLVADLINEDGEEIVEEKIDGDKGNEKTVETENLEEVKENLHKVPALEKDIPDEKTSAISVTEALEESLSKLEIAKDDKVVELERSSIGTASNSMHTSKDNQSIEESISNLKITNSVASVLHHDNTADPVLIDCAVVDQNPIDNNAVVFDKNTAAVDKNAIDDSSVVVDAADQNPIDTTVIEQIELGNYLKSLDQKQSLPSPTIPFKTHQSLESLTVILDTTNLFTFTTNPKELLLTFSEMLVRFEFPNPIGTVTVDTNDLNTCILIQKVSHQYWKWIRVDDCQYDFLDYGFEDLQDDVSLCLETRVSGKGIELSVTKTGNRKDTARLLANDLVFEID